jgi:hypothetical protein
MVAICDVLGFKRLVYETPLQRVSGAMTHLRRMLTYAVRHEDPKGEPPTMAELRSQANVEIVVFSDTIFLFAKDDSDDAVRELIEAVGWLLFGTTMSSVVGLRAGLAYGEVLLEPENDVFVGKPIVDAHLMETQQEWSGATLCDTAVERLARAGLTPETHVWLKKYPVPMKNEADRIERMVIDWTFGMHLPFAFQWSPTSSEPSTEDEAQRPDVVRKYRNTKTFHAEVCRYCRKSRARAAGGRSRDGELPPELRL